MRSTNIVPRQHPTCNPPPYQPRIGTMRSGYAPSPVGDRRPPPERAGMADKKDPRPRRRAAATLLVLTTVAGILLLVGISDHFPSDDHAWTSVVLPGLPNHASAQTADVLSLSAAGQIVDTEGADELMLNGPYSIATFESGGTTYAAVASYDDDGVQILQLTDSSGAILANPSAAGQIVDTEGTDELMLDGAHTITTFESGGTTYAAVAARFDSGVQIIDLSDPTSPTAAGKIVDTEGLGELFLGASRGITTFESGGTTYAAATSFSDRGVQILQLTDSSGAILANPSAAGQIVDTTGPSGLLLDASWGITTFESGGTTYAAVAASIDDGVQILQLTDSSGAILANPSAAGQIVDTEGADELMLNGARKITTFVSNSTTYAAVSSFFDDGVQILQLTDSSGAILANPSAAGQIVDTEGADELMLDWPSGITTFESGETTYAAVAASIDDGVQILQLTDSSGAILANPSAAGQIVDTEGADELMLNGSRGITTFVSNSTTYAAVAASIDDGVQIINLNLPLTVDAGSAQTVDEGDTVTLSGTAFDLDGDPLYMWTHDSALTINFANDTALSTNVYRTPSPVRHHRHLHAHGFRRHRLRF